jgi:3-oxoacyl-[acyl-carrier-protein] synthase-3
VGLRDYVGRTDGAKVDWIGIGADGRSMIVKGARVAGATHEELVHCARVLLGRNGLTPADVDWLLPIQTHARVVDGLCEALEWPAEKLLWSGDKRGFSGSASIPACLAEEVERGRVKKGDLVLSVAVGAGLNAAGALFSL